MSQKGSVGGVRMENESLNKNQSIVVDYLRESVLENREYSIYFILNNFHYNIIIGFGNKLINNAYRNLSIKEQYEVLEKLAYSLLDSTEKKWIDLNKNQVVVHDYLFETSLHFDKQPFFAISELCEIISEELKPKKVINAFNKLSEKEQYELLSEFARFQIAFNRIDWDI
ncbi:hypothetical protein RV15_GL003435 [Enterococcus silesiacus]|uniref:Uncharacterized protein n=2 Tax=Enterococcus silesiacus TaxID=332949 RepID=A0AA91GH03_9ENTE|nr:hypothetical protein RV15_GL003435 [Enterococcus silesiacus]